LLRYSSSQGRHVYTFWTFPCVLTRRDDYDISSLCSKTGISFHNDVNGLLFNTHFLYIYRLLDVVYK